jgi:hypothetical protein
MSDAMTFRCDGLSTFLFIYRNVRVKLLVVPASASNLETNSKEQRGIAKSATTAGSFTVSICQSFYVGGGNHSSSLMLFDA